MKITFPFEYIAANEFGKIFRPHATLYVFAKELKFYVVRTFVVDTGADFTVFPKNDAAIFGIDLARETIKKETFGIGGKEIIYLYKNLTIKIDNIKLTIPVGFLNRNDVPALLGRQACLEYFQLCFKDHKTILKK